MDMTHSITVGKYLGEGPHWWFNFLQACLLTVNGKSWEDLLDEKLKSYNAIYLSKISSSPMLIFDSEKDATVFILKWS